MKILPKSSELPPYSLPISVIAFLTISCFFLDNLISETFIYHRQLISQGEFWRLITGHFFHTNSFHLGLNMAALVLLCAIHGHFYTCRNYLLLFTFSALACSLSLYFFNPELVQYVGLSGILHGVFVWGALMDIWAKEKTGYLLFIGVWLKIAHEQFYGTSDDIAALIEANVAIDAHLWGAIGGLIFSAMYYLHKKTSQ